jgi:hypothetical protein
MQPLLVTTEYRGVFFGYGDYSKASERIIDLERARMVVYWPEQTHGVLGLTNKGPGPGSKITPAAPRLTLQGVTAVALCTEEAAKAWEAEPWS